MCNCDLCIRLRSVQEHIKALPEDKQEYFENLVDCMLDIEFDNDYYKAIFSGKWPSGKEVLERALEKYNEIPIQS
mgnify:CR=1 FL=1